MRNLLLFSFLVVLLILTYYLEELGTQKKSLEKEKESLAFNFLEESLEEEQSAKENLSTADFDVKDLQEVILGHARLQKKGNLFYTSRENFPVDQQVLELFFHSLAQIRIERIITAKERRQLRPEKFFQQDPSKILRFLFKNGEMKYRLGHKLDLSESFYMEVTKNGKVLWVVAQDLSPRPGIYLKEDTASWEKYDRLKTLLSASESYFYDRKILQDQSNIKASSLTR